MAQFVDFAHVEEKHAGIHQRLENWARWALVSARSQVHPMFRQARPAQHWQPLELQPSVDAVDAMLVEKGVAGLPDPHAMATRWCYVFRGSPGRACVIIGCSRDGLALYVRDARSMLVSRHI